MDVAKAIEERRSVRKFKDTIIPQATLEQLLTLATKAPSGKNRQPWRFVVLQDKKKAEFVKVMLDAVNKLQEQGINIGSSKISANAIHEASAVVVVFNAFSKTDADYTHYNLLMDTQSIGAAIQNLILAAQSRGLASLWICDVFYCAQDLCHWLNRQEEMVAAVAIGCPDQFPEERPRASWQDITEWRR